MRQISLLAQGAGSRASYRPLVFFFLALTAVNACSICRASLQGVFLSPPPFTQLPSSSPTPSLPVCSIGNQFFAHFLQAETLVLPPPRWREAVMLWRVLICAACS